MATTKVPTTFEGINWKGYRAIGQGSYGTVFVKGTRGGLAIKVGRIARSEVDGLRDAARAGLAVPIYLFIDKVRLSELPDHIRSELDYGHKWRSGHVSILVMGRATPYTVKHGTGVYNEYYDDDTKAYRDIQRLSERADEAGLHWTDDHPGNIGYYRRKLIILDGLNWESDELSDYSASSNSTSSSGWSF